MSIKQAEPAPELHGLLLVDKPPEMSSFDIIRALRRQTGVRKIGHAGTLDPAATGLMLMLFGSATKQARHLVGLDKSYQAELTLGVVSTTGDREGELAQMSDRQATESEVATALQTFTGTITQIPSAYSAIKVGGVRAYKLARDGKSVSMPPREITVYSITLLSYAYPVISLRAEVSSGTYIRSLAEDIGTALGTGAYLSRLRRLRIGQFEIAAAHQLADVGSATIERQLLSPLT